MGVANDEVFEVAAELFALLSAPTRLRIVRALCEGEKNVGELRERVGCTQSNVSQHLAMLYRGGVVGRRRVGAQIFYWICSDTVLRLCEIICEGQGELLRAARPAREPVELSREDDEVR